MDNNMAAMSSKNGFFSEYLEKSSKYKGYHYSVLSNDMIAYMHETCLEMTKEVLKVFRENNIRYSICGGTFLGAVTRQKFLPWDDDVDFCVLDEDYEKMKQCLLENLPSWMEVQCPETEPNYYHGWIKVRDKKSVCHPMEQKYKYKGVWLDIYKLSLVDKKLLPYIVAKEHLLYLVNRFLKGCLSKQDLLQRIEESNLFDRITSSLQESLASTDSQKSYMIMSASKIAIDSDCCFPMKKYSFEGLQLDGFKDANAYLTQHFGSNYNVVAPDELRRISISKIYYSKTD
jgi:lipopolysaccharide cholinephosphotransferase